MKVNGLYFSRHWRALVKCAAVALLAAFLASTWLVYLRIGAIGDRIIRGATAFVIVQSCVLAAMTAVIAATKVVGNMRRARIRKETGRIQERFADFAAGGESGDLVASARTSPAEFLAAMDHTLDWLSGGARGRVFDLFRKTPLFAAAVGDVGSPDPLAALGAVTLLAKFDSPECGRAVEAGLDHPEAMVRMLARRSILASGENESRQRVFGEISELAFWEKLILFHQISPSDPLLDVFLGDAISSTRDDMVLVALECILSRQRAVSIHVESRLASSSNPEIRIKFFKALPYLQTGIAPARLVAVGLGDSDWRVRAMSARAAGFLRVESLAEPLLNLMANAAQPAEAGHAARALAALGGASFQSLLEFTTSESEMLRRTASEVVERQMLGQAPNW